MKRKDSWKKRVSMVIGWSVLAICISLIITFGYNKIRLKSEQDLLKPNGTVVSVNGHSSQTEITHYYMRLCLNSNKEQVQNNEQLLCWAFPSAELLYTAFYVTD